MDIRTLRAYFYTYKQPFKVLYNIALYKFPFEAELRDGRKVKIESKHHAWWYATFFYNLRGLDVIESDENHIKFKYYGKILEFYYDIFTTISFKEIYVNEVYNVDVKEKTVVDVGAGVGDSSIYFALNGAKRVYAFDINIKYLEKNVKINGFADVIVPIQCNCGLLSNTLDIITYKYNIPSGSVLKVDCEGCEYGFFVSTLKNIQRYSAIVVEYHQGVQYLAERFKEAGFEVIRKGWEKVGLLYAFKHNA